MSIPVNILEGVDTEIHRNKALNPNREKGEEQGCVRRKGAAGRGKEQPGIECVGVHGLAEKFACF